MRTESAERPIPFTYNRAATELVQCQRHLDLASQSLELALEIFGRLDGDSASATFSLLEQVLGQLEETEVALSEAVTPMRRTAPGRAPGRRRS